MDLAIKQAKLAADRSEVPVGALIVKNGAVIAADGNRILELKDPTAHAELRVIRQAASILGTERLIECDLYVTLEPCPMCAGAISLSRIRRLYFGADDPKSGAVENGVRYFEDPTCHHSPEIYSGIQRETCRKLLIEFFSDKRS